MGKQSVFILNLVYMVSFISIKANDLKVNQHVFHVTNCIPYVVFYF